MLFPNRRYDDIAGFGTAYFQEMSKAAAAIDGAALDAAATCLAAAIDQRRWIYACGNGGSAAIANHLFCDFVKSIQTDTRRKPRVVPLSAQIEMITALGNDIGYDEVFVYQLSTLATTGDVLLTVSSSGDSPNIVKAVAWAKANGLATIALTGFDGGRSARLADINIHVPARNYGVIEDLHQSVMHILAQYLRQGGMPDDLFGQRKF